MTLKKRYLSDAVCGNAIFGVNRSKMPILAFAAETSLFIVDFERHMTLKKRCFCVTVCGSAIFGVNRSKMDAKMPISSVRGGDLAFHC